MEYLDIKDVMEECISIMETSLKLNKIEIITNIETAQKTETSSRELLQVYLNIIKNAQEILIEREIKEPQIVITISSIDDGYLKTEICDNAGCVPRRACL